MSKKNKKFKRQIRAEIFAELQRQESRAKTEKIASPASRERRDRNDTDIVSVSATPKIVEAKTENRGEPTTKKELLKILLTFGFLILVLIVLTVANQKNQFLDRGVERIFSRF